MEPRARPLCGLELEAAADARYQLLGQGEAYARAGVLGGEERVEDPIAQILGNPGAVVGDDDRQLLGRPAVLGRAAVTADAKQTHGIRRDKDFTSEGLAIASVDDEPQLATGLNALGGSRSDGRGDGACAAPRQ